MNVSVYFYYLYPIKFNRIKDTTRKTHWYVYLRIVTSIWYWCQRRL